MLARITHTVRAGAFGAILGISPGLILFGLAFAVALTMPIVHMGNPALPLLLTLSSCSIAGLLLGVAQGIRGRPFTLTARFVACFVCVPLVLGLLWLGLTPNGRSLVGAVMSREPFFDYRPARFWAAAAHADQEKLRLAAVEANRYLAARFDWGIAPLQSALKDPSRVVRLAAARALGRTGAGRPSVVAGLLGALKDRDRDVRYEAVRSLGEVGGADAVAAIPLLLELGQREKRLRRAIGTALGRMGGEALVDLLLLIDDTSWREAALSGLWWMHSDQLQLDWTDDLLLSRLNDCLADPAVASSAELRDMASLVAARLTPKAALLLCRQLSHPDRQRRVTALVLVKSVHSLPGEAFPLLADLVRRSSTGLLEAEVGEEVLALLERCHEDARATRLQLLADPNPKVRGQTALSLAADDFQLGTLRDESFLDPLLVALEDKDFGVSVRAAATLWRTKSHPPSLSVLNKAIIGYDAELQWIAAEAIADSRGNSDSVRGALRNAWARGNPGRRAVARALWLCDRDPEVLLQALEDEDETKSAWAGIAARDQTLEGERLFKAVVRKLPGKHGSAVKWPGVIPLLGRLGPAASPAVPLLRETLTNPDPNYRAEAAHALEKIGDPRVVPDLIPLLSDSDTRVVFSAAYALGEIGPLAAAALPALETVIERSAPDRNSPGYVANIGKWRIERSRTALRNVLREARVSEDTLQGLLREGPDYVTAIVVAFMKIGPDDIPWLIEALDDLELRNSALFLLSTLGSTAEGALPALFDKLGWRGDCADTIGLVIDKIKPGAVLRWQLLHGGGFCLIAGCCLALVVGIIRRLSEFLARSRTSRKIVPAP